MRPKHAEPPPLSAGDIAAYAWWIFTLTVATLTIAGIALAQSKTPHPHRTPRVQTTPESCGLPSPPSNPAPRAEPIP